MGFFNWLCILAALVTGVWHLVVAAIEFKKMSDGTLTSNEYVMPRIIIVWLCFICGILIFPH